MTKIGGQMAKLYGIGVGPGDSELLTLKGARLIRECPIIMVPRSGQKVNVAYTIAKGAVPEIEDMEVVEVDMPMVRDRTLWTTNHRKAADKVIEYLKQGKDVAFLTLGDPTVYSTYCYVHNMVLEDGYQAEIVPGVPSFCAVSARLNQGLTEASEALHIIPASYQGVDQAIELDGVRVLMKTGKSMAELKEKLKKSPNVRQVRGVERCGMPGERIFDDIDEIDDQASYFSVLVVK